MTTAGERARAVIENSQAAFEAFDGMEVSLPSGYVVRCRALTVTEGVRFLRLIHASAEDPLAFAALFREFPARVGITEAKLSDLGMVVEGVDLGDLTYQDAAEIELLRASAVLEMDLRKRSKAQIDLLEALPKKLPALAGLQTHEVYALAGQFVDEFYLTIYGLAHSFCSRLIRGPQGQATNTRPEAPSSRSGSTT